MATLVQNRWTQMGAVGVLTALLGVVIGALSFSGVSSGPEFGPVKLTSGGTIFVSGDGARIGALQQVVELELPLTGAEAVAAGWTDPILCSTGRGKYFQRAGDPEVPYVLMYDSLDQLIGIYLLSNAEKPSPWERAEQITSGGVPIIDYEHWGLFVYFQDQTRACSLDTGRGASGCAPGSC